MILVSQLPIVANIIALPSSEVNPAAFRPRGERTWISAALLEEREKKPRMPHAAASEKCRRPARRGRSRSAGFRYLLA
jgi:hypothetical protein